MWTRCPSTIKVALRKESVDRNNFCRLQYDVGVVALRKESVDRNWVLSDSITPLRVALRKESVDRNKAYITTTITCTGRSPQGERG